MLKNPQREHPGISPVPSRLSIYDYWSGLDRLGDTLLRTSKARHFNQFRVMIEGERNCKIEHWGPGPVRISAKQVFSTSYRKVGKD